MGAAMAPGFLSRSSISTLCCVCERPEEVTQSTHNRVRMQQLYACYSATLATSGCWQACINICLRVQLRQLHPSSGIMQTHVLTCMHAHTLQAQKEHTCWQAVDTCSWQQHWPCTTCTHSATICSKAGSDSRAPGQVGDKLDDLCRQPDLLVASDAGNDVEDAGDVLQGGTGNRRVGHGEQ